MEQDRFRQISKVLWIILILNFAVAASKLFYGWFINSASIMADGYHSFSDGSSNIIGLFGIWMASRPKDERHPYGHGKYETLTSVGIALLLFLVCVEVLSESIKRFYHPVHPEVDAVSFAVMGVTLIVNIFVMLYERRQGRVFQSEILISDSLHTGADIFTTGSVIIGLLAIRAGYPIVDPVVALFISIFIGYAGVEIIRSSSQILLDAAAIDEEQIRAIVMGVNGIEYCHKIRSRGRKGDIHVDMHCHMKRDISLEKAHAIAHVVENTIKENIPGVKDVTIHIEPAPEDIPS
ncbi:MAG: cation diffusion facilitator family transporter [Desulfovibrionales bacterium]|nr:cation diffusion facilitator family transporter [Desulfovibrionales bacterium]